MIYNTPDQIARDAAAVSGALAAFAAERGVAAITVAGTPDVMTAAMPANVSAPFPDGKAFVFESLGANNGLVTLDIGGTGAREVTHTGGATLLPGDIPAIDTLVEVFWDTSVNKYHAQLIRQPSSAVPLAPAAVGQAGTSTRYAREDHIHPLPAGNYQFRVGQGNTGAGSSVNIVFSTPFPTQCLSVVAIPIAAIPYNAFCASTNYSVNGCTIGTTNGGGGGVPNVPFAYIAAGF